MTFAINKQTYERLVQTYPIGCKVKINKAVEIVPEGTVGTVIAIEKTPKILIQLQDKSTVSILEDFDNLEVL